MFSEIKTVLITEIIGLVFFQIGTYLAHSLGGLALLDAYIISATMSTAYIGTVNTIMVVVLRNMQKKLRKEWK